MAHLSFEVGDVGRLIAKEGEGVIGTGGDKIVGHMLELAIRTGFPHTSSDVTAIHAFFDGQETFLDSSGNENNAQDWVDNLSDTALQWMNNNVAPEGSVFQWHEDSFYLSEIGETP
jgi:hypothetical protein